MTADLEVLRRATVPADRLRLSVVVPSYNTAPYVRQTLASLLTQTMADLEVVVIDDGSRDDSLAVLSAVDDPRVTIARQTNRGLAGSRNSGVRLSRAAVIGFCDADDVWYPAKAEKHLALLDAEPSVGLTFSYSAYLSEDGAPTGQFLLSRCRAPTARDIIRRNHIGNGSTIVLRRELFTRAGLFDETLGSCEDFEMWVRVTACTTFSARLIPEVLTGYRVRSGSMSTTYDVFLGGFRRALDRFRTYVPEFSDRDAARSYAECLRIASRKAFSSGNVAYSRTLFAAMLRESPTLPLRDLRAFGMLGLHACALILPVRSRQWVYPLVRAAMKQAFRAILALELPPPARPATTGLDNGRVGPLGGPL